MGRDDGVAVLRATLEQISLGAGKTVLISGEAGIGKSRLVRDAVSHWVGTGIRVWQGNCYEHDRALPFAPFVDLLRKYAASLENLAGLPQLLRLAPDLAHKFPDVNLVPPAEPEQEKRLVLHAWATLLTSPNDFQHPAAPTLLILEDLHWCDDVSLELLVQLSRVIATHPFGLVLTYRSDEATPALNHLLAQLDREHLAREIELKRLQPAETAAVIRAIFGAEHVRDEFLEAIQALTDGNPFFIEECLRSLVESGDIFLQRGVWTRRALRDMRIPRTVQDTVQRRVAQLAEPSRELLQVAAIAGRKFDFDLLLAVTQQPERALLTQIKTLIAAQLVSETSADVFEFRHALTQQAVVTGLLARERRALHARIFDASERRFSNQLESRWAELAHHAHGAELWEKSLLYSQRAGEQAQRLFSPRVAIEHFSRAIEASEAMPVQAGDTRVRALYRARAQARETVGDFDLARRDYEAALAQAQSSHDGRAEWENLFSLGFLWTARDMPTSHAYLDRALQAARRMDDPTTLGYSLNRVGNWLLNMNQPAGALRNHEEALRIFAELGDSAGLAATHDLLGITHMLRTDYVACRPHHAQAAALFRQLDNRHGLISTLAMSSNHGGNYQSDTSVFAPEDTDTCWRYGDEARRLAQGVGWRFGEAMSNMFLATAMGTRGAFARAFACAQTAMDIALDIDALVWEGGTHMMFGRLYLDVLALPMARLHGERGVELARQVGATEQLRTAAALLAQTLIAQGEWARAEALLAEFHSQLYAATQTVSLRGIVSAQAELALARGDAQMALKLTDQLIQTAAHTGEGAIVPRLWHVRGQALHKLSRHDEAERVLQAGADAARAQSLMPACWRILASLGKLHRSRRRAEQAQAAFQQAREIVGTLAAELSAAELRDGFLQGFEVMLGEPPHITPLRAAKQAFDGLTAREREVAACVARGMTNKAIAEQLVVSERTVEKHVENAMGKLGFSSRSQLAVWAAQKL